MKVALRAVGAFTIVMAATALAGEGEGSGRRASPATKPSWEFAITAYPTVVRGGENYTSAIAVADHGPPHFEARYNYESIGARPDRRNAPAARVAARFTWSSELEEIVSESR